MAIEKQKKKLLCEVLAVWALYNFSSVYKARLICIDY